MKNIIDIYEASLLDIDGTMEEGDKYSKDITEFFDEVNKHLKNVKTWDIKRPNYNPTEWVSYGFNITLNDTILSLLLEPLKMNRSSYKAEQLYLNVHVLWHNWYKDKAKCYIEVMQKGRTDIIVRCGTKSFKPKFNGNSVNSTNDKEMIDGMLKPAIKDIFKPALKDMNTLIEFMTTQHD